MISQRQQTTHGKVRTEVCQMLNVVVVVEARSWPPRETQRLRTLALASLTSGSSAASSSLAPAAFSTVAAKILGAPNGQYIAVTGVGGRLELPSMEQCGGALGRRSNAPFRRRQGQRPRLTSRNWCINLSCSQLLLYKKPNFGPDESLQRLQPAMLRRMLLVDAPR